MKKTIRIGTRDSQLALWQANKVRKELIELGFKSVLVPVKSLGDIVLDKPLYELGVAGVFTKNLDLAMLNGDIDIAVHSLKDVPTCLPKGIVQAAVLKRANYNDVLVLKDTEDFLEKSDGIIATGSLRRKAMWLNKYPTHKVVNLRGNINTRLQKIENNDWNGAIFAVAGLERIGKLPKESVSLPWMVPAPAQGAIMIAALENDKFSNDACKRLNDKETEKCVAIEREFLRLLEGGCSAPIGALAYVNNYTNEINFKGVLLKTDGSKKITISKNIKIGNHQFLAKDCAQYIIDNGGKELMLEDRVLLNEESRIYSTKKLSEIQKKSLGKSILLEDSDFVKTHYNKISKKVMKSQLENVVITSQNGVEAILNSFDKNEINFKNIFCVGNKTKELIEKRIGKVVFCSKNALKLAEHISMETKIKELTYFCSDIRLDFLPNYLQENNIIVNEIESYKTTSSSLKIDDSVSGLLFFSPSGVESYLEKNHNNKIAFCIGETTALEARKYFKNVQVASTSEIGSILELANNYYKNKY